MIVLVGDYWSPHFARALGTHSQLWRSSSTVCPPQYRLSASLATYPSCKQSPNTLHKSFSWAVLEPGMLIAHLVYTRISWYDVTMPQYFDNCFHRRIWWNALVKSRQVYTSNVLCCGESNLRLALVKAVAYCKVPHLRPLLQVCDRCLVFLTRNEGFRYLTDVYIFWFSKNTHGFKIITFCWSSCNWVL